VTVFNDHQQQKPFYSGPWQVSADHFTVKSTFSDSFDGSYDAYNNSATITLIGKGTQESNNKTSDIKIVMAPKGNDTNVSYYLDGNLNSYQIIKGYSPSDEFDISVKIWEGRLSDSDDAKSIKMDDTTTITKPA